MKNNYCARIIIPRDTFTDDEHIRTTLDNNSNVKEEGGEIYSYITKAQYAEQMKYPDALWKCPSTGIIGFFDGSFFEEKYNIRRSK